MSEAKKNTSAELSDEALDKVTGGDGWTEAGMLLHRCPDCSFEIEPRWVNGKLVCTCGHIYKYGIPAMDGFAPGDAFTPLSDPD